MHDNVQKLAAGELRVSAGSWVHGAVARAWGTTVRGAQNRREAWRAAVGEHLAEHGDAVNSSTGVCSTTDIFMQYCILNSLEFNTSKSRGLVFRNERRNLVWFLQKKK